MNASSTIVEFERALRENGIPPRPTAIEAIVNEMRKEEPDLHLLEHALRSDVAVAAGIFKIVNSAYFGLQRHVRSVMEALVVMGLKTAGQTVACVCLHSAFPGVRLERFWDASVRVAELSGWLVCTKQWPGVRSEDAYTYGLFRDCGIAVLLQRMPSYVDVLRHANGEHERPFTSVEEDVLPVSHAHVGVMLTRTWWLPAEITEAIRFHHNVSVIEPHAVMGREEQGVPSSRCGALIAVSQLADYLYQTISGMGKNCEWDKLGGACLRQLAIPTTELPDLLRQAERVLQKKS